MFSLIRKNRLTKMLGLCLMAAFSVPAGASEYEHDIPEFRTLLVGSWFYEMKSGPVHVKGVVTYRDNGTGFTNQVIALPLRTGAVTIKRAVYEHWKLYDHVVMSEEKSGSITISESERASYTASFGVHPEERMLKPGKKEFIEIVDISNDELEIRLPGGKGPKLIIASRTKNMNPMTQGTILDFGPAAAAPNPGAPLLTASR